MTVVATKSRSPDETWARLWAESDVLSLHCPLTEATRGLIDDAVLDRLKPGAFVVNCARGAILDRDAVERALATGRLGGLALDVYWDEPWDADDPLYHREDVITMPHVAGATQEALARIADIVCENIRRAARGTPPLHRVA